MCEKKTKAQYLYDQYIQNSNVDIVYYNSIPHIVVCFTSGRVCKSTDVLINKENINSIIIISPYAVGEVWVGRKHNDCIFCRLYDVKAFEKRQGYGTALMNVLYSFCSSLNKNMRISWDSTKEGCHLYDSLSFVQKIEEKCGPFSYGVYEMNC